MPFQGMGQYLQGWQRQFGGWNDAQEAEAAQRLLGVVIALPLGARPERVVTVTRQETDDGDPQPADLTVTHADLVGAALPGRGSTVGLTVDVQLITFTAVRQSGSSGTYRFGLTLQDVPLTAPLQGNTISDYPRVTMVAPGQFSLVPGGSIAASWDRINGGRNVYQGALVVVAAISPIPVGA